MPRPAARPTERAAGRGRHWHWPETRTSYLDAAAALAFAAVAFGGGLVARCCFLVSAALAFTTLAFVMSLGFGGIDEAVLVGVHADELLAFAGMLGVEF